MTRTSFARAKFFLTSVISASTVSPVITKGTNTTICSRRPTPSPPKAISWMVRVMRSPIFKDTPQDYEKSGAPEKVIRGQFPALGRPFKLFFKPSIAVFISSKCVCGFMAFVT